MTHGITITPQWTDPVRHHGRLSRRAVDEQEGEVMGTTRVVVVGADAAGMSAAHQALRTARAHGRDLDLVALERTPWASYSACGIPYWVAGDVASADDLVARSPEQHREMGLDLRTGAEATRLDLAARTVSYRDADGDSSVAFDEVVLATGAAPIVPTWARNDAGALVTGVHPVKDLGDGARWIDLLGTVPAVPSVTGATVAPGAPVGDARPHGVIVGGGYIGVEMAETLLRRGWGCTLVTRSTVMSSLDPDVGARVAASLERAGVDVRTHATVDHLEVGAAGGVRGVVLHDGDRLRADAVVLALGVRPTTALGRDAGLPVGEWGGYLTDASGRLADGLWAAGDCCETRHRLTGRSVFAPLGTHANKQGRVVGTCLGGGEARFEGVLGTAITRFAANGEHLEIARTGLSTAEAEAAGLRPVSLLTESSTASGYMPEATPIAMKVIADPDTRRLLGLQIVGGAAAGKRIDTAAACLWGGLSVDDLAAMDLSYAPPFATTWEAVQLAARRSAERL